MFLQVIGSKELSNQIGITPETGSLGYGLNQLNFSGKGGGGGRGGVTELHSDSHYLY